MLIAVECHKTFVSDVFIDPFSACHLVFPLHAIWVAHQMKKNISSKASSVGVQKFFFRVGVQKYWNPWNCHKLIMIMLKLCSGFSETS